MQTSKLNSWRGGGGMFASVILAHEQGSPALVNEQPRAHEQPGKA